MSIKTFEICFDDLSKRAQEEFCAVFETSPADEILEIPPLAVVERKMDEEDLIKETTDRICNLFSRDIVFEIESLLTKLTKKKGLI